MHRNLSNWQFVVHLFASLDASLIAHQDAARDGPYACLTLSDPHSERTSPRFKIAGVGIRVRAAFKAMRAW